MPIFQIDDRKFFEVERTTFEAQGLRERHDLQSMLKSQIEVIASDILVVSEEFGDWEGSRRRIDLLGIDRDANLVVIELKRTEDGGHMDLQAIRYAAMISTLTFDKLVETFARYMGENNIEGNASEKLLDFLAWSEPDEDEFGQQVRIILVSAEFSKELTTSVLWLNEFGLYIECVRLQLYINEGKIFMDVQTVIPVPGASEYQVNVREKRQRERASKTSNRDYSKFDVTTVDEKFPNVNKRWTMFYIVKGLLEYGVSPQKIQQVIDSQFNKKIFESFNGILTSDEVKENLSKYKKTDPIRRYFIDEEQIFHAEERTWILTNQWGANSEGIANLLISSFPQAGITIRKIQG